eukprot:c39106_g1_i1.p1 GENE.c39106_g1_i1~~c39106_g1_i1.p1  ORF type:complete len:523 (-),score=85.81 c39106_g1_i1:29-1597(-)
MAGLVVLVLATLAGCHALAIPVDTEMKLDTQVLLTKTLKIWSAKDNAGVFAGPASNSAPHTVSAGKTAVAAITDETYEKEPHDGSYLALLFIDLDGCQSARDVWESVAFNLLTSEKQRDLTMAIVDADHNSKLASMFNITSVPTAVLVDRERVTALGRFSAAFKPFDLSTWIQDLIVSDEHPVTKTRFVKKDEPELIDHNPIWPYSGSGAFPDEIIPRTLDANHNIIQGTASPSPSPVCHFTDDEEMAENILQMSCSTMASKLMCQNRGAIGQVAGSVCPATCASCGIAALDNDIAFGGLFKKFCQTADVSDCTCKGVHDSYLKVCTLASLHPVNRYIATICPQTCADWAHAYIRADRTLNLPPAPQAQATQFIQTSEPCTLAELDEITASKFGPDTNVVPLLREPVTTFLLDAQALEISPKSVPAKPTFVLFCQSECTTCQTLQHTWQAVSGNQPTDRVLGSVDTLSKRQLTTAFGVAKVPTIAFFEAGAEAGEVFDIFEGEHTEKSVEEWMNLMIKSRLS